MPSLTVVNQTAGVATFAIRGIIATTGAATTGVYIDDTALTKRNNPGVSQNNGAPTPLLFDLQRVEVLKGPQGTLYGGSSQGGTIRFITPAPSLTEYSGNVRLDQSYTQEGAQSSEYGAAFGGPLVENSLGLRISGVVRNTGGWIDWHNVYATGATTPDNTRREDVNGSREWAVRAALAKKFGANGLATVALYRSHYRDEGGAGSETWVYAPDGTRAPATQTYTTPQTCFNNSTRPATATTNPAAVACTSAGITFTRAAQTYGPFNYLGQDQTITPFDGVIGIARTMTTLPSLTVDYEFGKVQFKSITSYLIDETDGNGGESNDPGRVQTTVENPGRTSFPLFRPVQAYGGRFLSNNRRVGWEQEFRLSSPADSGRLSWVAGLYYANLGTHIQYIITGNYDANELALYGITATQRYSVPNPGGFVSVLDARIQDTEAAIFGEGTFALTDKLKATAGLRYSVVKLDFGQANYGQLSARPTIDSPFAYTTGHGKDTPTTPKLGLQYELRTGSMVYANAAKGFRAGGVNVALNPQVCTAGLALFGLTINDIPPQYGPDTVISYELGGKFRLQDGRLQVNAALYQIDWNDIQITNSAQGCGQNWNSNGGKARSTGVDLQVDYRPVDTLTLNLSVGTTNAKYREPVLGPKPTTAGVTQSVSALAGDPLGVADLSGNAGLRYDFGLAGRKAFARLDYLYTGAYTRGTSYGTANYNPFTREVPSQYTLNARLGTTIERWDLSLYAQNLTNNRQVTGNAGNGRGGCSSTAGPDCSTYTLFNPFVGVARLKPRVVGLQAGYKF